MFYRSSERGTTFFLNTRRSLPNASIEPYSGTAEIQNTGVSQLLCKVPEVGTAEIVSGRQPAVGKMGTQQVPEVQAEVLVSGLQIFTGDSQNLPQYV